MSKILSYNHKTTGEGWTPLPNQYSADEIQMIADPNGGLSQRPRTAIPSPFAQMDLVKNAFRRLSFSPSLVGELMDERLVSNALDVAQVFFNLPELSAHLRVVEWSRQREMQLLRSEQEHRLLADTMEMFMEQDAEAFNFDKMDRLYFLQYGSEVIGSTSPVTLFMASPNAHAELCPLPVEQNVTLFQTIRPLYKREERFVMYLYGLFTAQPELKKLCGEVNAYLITCFELLNPELRRSIIEQIGDPKSVDPESLPRARQFMETAYTLSEPFVQVLGVPFRCARQTDIEAAISQSDFRIRPTLHTDDERLPLVLPHRSAPGLLAGMRYVTGMWDDSIRIQPNDYDVVPSKRILPGTSHQYPWITADDLLQPTLVKLDYTMDRDCYFDGNLSVGSIETDDADFLLPLTPLFYHYFTVQDLMGTISGRPRLEMIHTKTGVQEQVNVILRIPVQKEGTFITIERNYVKAVGTDFAYDRENDKGVFLTLPFSLSIFPFVRCMDHGQYNVQLVDRALGDLQNYRVGLSFHRADDTVDGTQLAALCRHRSDKQEKRVGSDYYLLTDTFDYITVSLDNEQGRTVAQGMVCPRWPHHTPGHEAFTFAVDFGTTNTHLEYMRGSQLPRPLTLSSDAKERLVATLYNGSHVLYDVIMKQEFLPERIGDAYGFPQRTVISEPERLDTDNADRVVALGDANIPFIYEKESVGYGNRIVPNLKWSTEPANAKRVRAYLYELALLMRTKVLLENGDISKTRLVWFYPLSMKIGNVRKMTEMWAKTFAEVFGLKPDAANIIQMPESVAPYYYYKETGRFRGAASTVALVDIGGGTSDVAVFGPDAAAPVLLSSFRFAANAVFGDAFSEVPHGDSNPLVVKYVDYFRRLFNADDDKYGELNGILDDICAKRKSEDINTFLFSIVNNAAVGGNDVFSYNQRLNEDGRYKIVFIYFFATIIYHIASMMHHRKLPMPRTIMFSGTGSKVLDIVGNKFDLELLSQQIIEAVYGTPYGEDGFSIVMERDEPKQITCRGGLMVTRDPSGCVAVDKLNAMLNDVTDSIRYNFNTTDRPRLRYADMQQPEVRAEIVAKVKAWNELFIELAERLRVTDRFLVDLSAFNHFKEWVNRDLDHYLVNAWNVINKYETERNMDDEVEDTVFFYPIIGSIRDNLIEHC